MQLLVIAKAPVAGRVKTRLCPPCTPAEAASIAESCLRDTLAAVRATPAGRRVVVLDGEPGPWLPPDVDVIPQRTGSLGDRLRGAFADCFADDATPVVLIGMDTPQVTPAQLTRAAGLLDRRERDRRKRPGAVLGPAVDGGYWLIGLEARDDRAFDGVPMSVEETMARQQDRLVACGYDVTLTDVLRDVDTADDALALPAALPTARRARRLLRAPSPA